MNELDKIMEELNGTVFNKENNIPEYEKTTKQKRDEFKSNVKSFTDWYSQPLNVLIGCILLAGAFLMYLSLFALTGNAIISILLISISEAGILGWEFARERTKNTETQTHVAGFMRNWHVGTSIILLVTNIIIESTTQALAMYSLKVDGLIYLIFAVIGLTALLDLSNYFKFKDNDRESTNKRKFNSKMDTLKADTQEQQLDAYAESEKIKSQAIVDYWRDNAGTLAEISGKIDAAKQIKAKFRESGLSDSEIESIMKKIDRPETRLLVENTSSNEIVATALPQKRKYTKHHNPERELKAEQKLEEKLEELNIGGENKIEGSGKAEEENFTQSEKEIPQEEKKKYDW